MDELTLLRSVRNDEEAVDAETLARGRAKLLARAGIEDSPRSKERVRRGSAVRRVRWVGVGALVAGGVAAVMVVGNVTGFAGLQRGADPAAAAVLNEAASRTIRTSDPVLRPGQYLEVDTKAAYLGAVVTERDSASFLSSQDSQLYIPANATTGTWIWVRDAERPLKTFGVASADAAKAANNPGAYVAAKGGAFYGSPANPSPAELASLSRDPGALLRHIYTVTNGQGPSRDGEALVWIADTLRSGIVPADLRAALYKAAANIPGVEVTDREANLDGRIGVAIGRAESDGTRQELIIDQSTGLLIGEREVATGKAAAEANVPNGTAIGWTAVRTSIVDVAPGRGSK